MIILSSWGLLSFLVLPALFLVAVVIAYFFDYRKNPKYFKEVFIKWIEFILKYVVGGVIVYFLIKYLK